MTFLGLSFMWWALLGSYTLVGLLSFACFYLADRLDASRRARSPLTPITPSLPVAQVRRRPEPVRMVGVRVSAVPAAWRRDIARKCG